MKKTLLPKITAILLLCFAICGCGKDEEYGKGYVYGTVTDVAGNLVGNANVQLLRDGIATLEATLTGSDGRYEIIDVPSGTYSLKVTKEGYSDLLDDHDIVVTSGKGTKRDVQIKRLPSSLHIYDNDHQEISVLDFGADAGITQKTFNIYNGGYQSLQYVITIPTQADWVSISESQQTGTIGAGVTFPIIVTINRAFLAEGNNTTTMLITSSTDGGKELTVKARKSSSGNGVYEILTVGLMVQTEDLGRVDWASAKLLCENSTVAGYNDWRLPTKEELMTLYTNKDQIGGFVEEGYWSSSNSNSSDQHGPKYYYVDFDNGAIHNASQTSQFNVRAVRTWNNSAPLVLLDNSNNEITELDFGSDANTTQKTFRIKNTGTQSVHYDVTNTANWITSTNPGNGELGVGSTTSVIVTINRDLLAVGENSSSLLINAPNNGGKELVIRAIKLGDGTITLETANLMVQTQDLGQVDWYSAKTMCENSTIAGYNDWRLPTKEELMVLYNNKTLIGGFYGDWYWSSDFRGYNNYNFELYYCVSFITGSIDSDLYYHDLRVRAVRTLNGGNSVTTPTVTTNEPSNVTNNSAACGGNVTSNGGADIIQRGICFGTSLNPTTSNQIVTSGTGTGSFTCNLTGLSANTTYYVRAYAINSAGTGYGAQKSFNTDSGGSAPVLPTVNTTEPSSVTSSTATCGGIVTSDGGADIFQRGVCYSTSPNPTTSDIILTSGTGTGSFSCILTGLTPNTTYYVRAYAVNSAGTGYGIQKSFVTESVDEPIDGWLYYDDIDVVGHAGLTDGGTLYWANMFPPSMLAPFAGTGVSKVEVHLDVTGNYSLQIFQGGQNSPGTLLFNDVCNVTSAGGYVTFTLASPVYFDATQNLWIVLGKTHAAGEYPAGYSNLSIDPNSRWVSIEGEWMDSEDYTWVMHTYVTNSEKGSTLIEAPSHNHKNNGNKGLKKSKLSIK